LKLQVSLEQHLRLLIDAAEAYRETHNDPERTRADDRRTDAALSAAIKAAKSHLPG
jgi:hypothetical protein